MRAVGMQRTQVRNLILIEAFFLAVCSVVVGLVVSLGALETPVFVPTERSRRFRHISWTGAV